MHRQLLLFGLALSLGCGPTRPPNIVLIVVDTLRADRLGAYDSARDLTPEIDALARRGTVFGRAYSQTSWTSPSVASLMTSRYQLQHGVLLFSSVLPESELTLAEALQARGYATGGFTANTALPPQRGYAQGFDEYSSFSGDPTSLGFQAYTPAERVNAEVLRWIDGLRGDPPIFLYIQYMEPHSPYYPSQAALDKVRPDGAAMDLERINSSWFLSYGKRPRAESLKTIQDLYDAEIIDLDRQIGLLVGELDERGALDGSILVITSDHGEEFGEHGSRGHGATLFEEVVHVPLVILHPGASAGRRVDTVVELVDLAPTLLDLAGLQVPDVFEGDSLHPLLTRSALPPDHGSRHPEDLLQGGAAALTELHRSPFDRKAPRHRRSLITSEQKIAIRYDSQGEDFYDLRSDPHEQNPNALAADERLVLRERLAAAARRTTSSPADRTEKPLDAETRDNLRALGYIE